MAHRTSYPRRRWVHAFWLIWMTTLTVGVGAIAMISALFVGVALFVLSAFWVVNLH